MRKGKEEREEEEGRVDRRHKGCREWASCFRKWKRNGEGDPTPFFRRELINLYRKLGGNSVHGCFVFRANFFGGIVDWNGEKKEIIIMGMID